MYVSFFSKKQILLLSISFLLCLQLVGQTWEQLNDSPFYKHHSNGFGIGDKAYVIEGTYQNDGPNSVSNEVWEYDSTDDTWKRIADFPGEGRAIAIGDEWNGKYYYGFGRGANGTLNDLWEFDPTDQSFTQLPSCPCPGRSHPAFIAHNDKIYMGSGSSDTGDVDDWWEYDMQSQEWTQKEDIPGGDRHHPFFFSNEDKLYVGGGHRPNWLEYDLVNEQWTEIDGAPEGRVAGSQLNFKGLGLIVGGDDASHEHVPDSESFMSYNPESDTWDYLPELPNGSKWAPSSFIIDDELYFFGGLSSNIAEDSTMWKIDLNFLGCLPAQNLMTTIVTGNSANIIWSQGNDVLSDTLKWRVLGSNIWNNIPNPQAVLTLDNLDACQEYEMVLVTQCDSLLSTTEIVVFKTDGCCVNPELEIQLDSENNILLSWESILAAESYDLRWRELGETTWSETNLSEQSFVFSDALDCEEYEFQIQTICEIDPVSFSESVLILTKGCGACIDLDFCAVSEDLEGDFIFINEVGINDYLNTTGSDGGYANYAVPDAESIKIGETFSITLDPGISDNGFAGNFSVWLDYDGDGFFNNDELIVDAFFVESKIERTILVSATATPGLSRMRVLYGINNPGGPCDDGSFELGEVEDYCINILESTSSTDEDRIDENSLVVLPNPFNSVVKVEGNFFYNSSSEFSLELINVVGEMLLKKNQFDFREELDLSFVPNGLYFLRINNGLDQTKTVKVFKQD